MKNELTIFALILMLLFCSIMAVNASTWQPNGSTWAISTVDSLGQDPSLTLDSNGRPHISYQDLENDDLKYAFWDGSSWIRTTVDSVSYVGYTSSLALDSNDRPHISYSFRWIPFNSKYAVLEGNSWKITNVDFNGSMSSSLALDSKGRPHISYSSTSLWYVFWNGTFWKSTIVDSSGNVGEYLSLAMDSKDQPHICYCLYEKSIYSDHKNGILKYARFSGANWEFMTIDSVGLSTDINLVLDSNDRPHITYCDGNAPYHLKYAVLENNSFNSITVDPDIAAGIYSSLAIDCNNRPHIAYYDITNSTYYDDTNTLRLDTATGILKYARFTGADWEILTVNSQKAGFDMSLVLDGNDQPHISYYDLVNHDLKYAVLASSTPMAPLDSQATASNGEVTLLYVASIVLALILGLIAIIIVKKAKSKGKSG